MTASWRPSLGAIVRGDATTFQVWAPSATTVSIEIETAQRTTRHSMARDPDAFFTASVAGVGAGARYYYRVNGDAPWPDPASRYQPDGVHGPSMVVDPTTYDWHDAGWRGIDLAELIVYELHIGTFTRAGTFEAAAGRLEALCDLGVTAIEIMPVADFAGQRNWGYDGVALFAPARCYGAPDDLRRLVDRAHALGMAVLLDVVYNHLGPDGAVLNRFSAHYFSSRRTGAWGATVNLDGDKSVHVRQFFIENALHWMHEYHVDGLRLDATHALHDAGEPTFLAELAQTLHARAARSFHVIAEDDRNLARIVAPASDGGWGLDAVWADDFHHQMRRALAGDADGYFADYDGTTTAIAATVRQGWFYTGQFSGFLRAPRGTSARGVPPHRCVVCLQNHDQIGNRALGDRLHHRIELAPFRAASALLLLLPETPLLFMGQEWAATSPFLYFTDHTQELGRQVTEGRRREFASFAAFTDSAGRDAIPDPQAIETFARSILDWDDRTAEPHASTLRLYTTLIALRRQLAAEHRALDAATAEALDADTIALRRTVDGGGAIIVCARLRGSGRVTLPDRLTGGARAWTTDLTTEDPAFAASASPPSVDRCGVVPEIEFFGPAAVVLREAHREP
jgi:maltooligosyltrehalose trehalohydrolase